MPTSAELAADADGVIGEWTDQFENEYVVTGCSNAKYSVTVTYKHGNQCGEHKTWEKIITRDVSGNYLWGCTHKTCLQNGCVDLHLQPVKRRRSTGDGKEKTSAFVRPERNKWERSHVRAAGSPMVVCQKYTATLIVSS